MKKRIFGIVILLLILLLMLSCLISPTPTQDLQLTIDFLNNQATVNALILTQTALPLIIQPAPTDMQIIPPTYEPVIEVTESIPTPEILDINTLMKDARILLFEDMIGRPKTRRVAKETLEGMGLKYEDVGSAKGWLKERLLFGASGGEPWDLIILAVENRTAGSITGEFFSYLRSNLDKGSSVILEAWHLDQIKNGEIKPILDKCGITVENYTGVAGSAMDLVLWPLTTHPILTEPNNYPRLTKPTFYWQPSDYGDLMYITSTGDATLLIGRDSSQPTRHGVVVVCMGGQLIIQTFSSHNYDLDTMKMIWENYIYNALKTRFMGRQ